MGCCSMNASVDVLVALKTGRKVRLTMTHSTLHLLHTCVAQRESKSRWAGGFVAAEVAWIRELGGRR